MFEIRSWERIWVVVKGSFLYCYGGERETTQLGVICLKDARVQRMAHHKRSFCFEVLHEDRYSIHHYAMHHTPYAMHHTPYTIHSSHTIHPSQAAGRFRSR
jgi:hypothetical protein